MSRRIFGVALVSVWMAGSAMAGPVADFEAEFRAMYGDYRTVLFSTNSGNAAKSAASLQAFEAGWAAIKADHAAAPPPQYADDAQWATMIDDIDALVAKAGAEIAAGTLPEAHVTLEGVRDVFSALHMRNHIHTFSDRMNAYHAEMEHVLGMDPAVLTEADLPEVTGRAAVLMYLAREVMAAPPAEAADNATFAKLVKGFEASVTAFDTAAKAGDLEAVRAAMAGLKKPYAMLFLNFG